MGADGRAGGARWQVLVAPLAGAGIALCHGLLERQLASLFWPKIAAALLSLGVLAFGAGALGWALLPERARRPLARVGPAWPALWLAAAAGAWLATRAVAGALLPGKGLGLASFPAWYLLLLAAPYVIAGAAISSRAAGGAGRALGRFAAGAGAGALLLVALDAAPLGDPEARFEFLGAAGGPLALGVDRRLREDVVAPAEGARLAVPLSGGGDRRLDALMVGFPNGPVLETLLERRRVRITVLESDERLVAAVTRRWPALAEARRAGRVVIVGGNPRLALARAKGRYDLVVLAENWSYGAALSWALNFRRDHRYTVEAFRGYLALLRPEGFLFVQRAGMGRVVTTLREACGEPPAVFAGKLWVLGQPGRLVSQCWYRPAGIQEDEIVRSLSRYFRETQSHVLYRPDARERWNFYYPLVTGERVKGLYFSTPLDLAPATDARPFFDHHERLRLSPAGSALPEELDPFELGWVLRVIPAGDWPVWAVFLAGCLLAAAGLGALARGRAGARAALPACLFLGAAAGLGLEAFAAWAAWLAPSLPLARVAGGAALLAFGLAWALGAPRAARPAWLLAAAALAALFGAGGYRVAGAAFRLGDAPLAAAVALAGILLGALAGRSFGAAFAELGSRLPEAAPWLAGAALLAAALALAAAPLLAVTFGYPLLWTLAAVATLAALRRRRFLPAGAAT